MNKPENQPLSKEELRTLVRDFNKAIKAESELRRALKAVGYSVYGYAITHQIQMLKGTKDEIKADNTRATPNEKEV